MQIISPEKIAQVMLLSPVPHTFSELDARVRLGLPKSALRVSVGHIGRNTDERRSLQNSIVPEATYKRRGELLNADESEKTERLARVFATAEFVWNSESDAREYLHTPHPLLDNRTPLHVSMTELGARRVEDLLWRLYFGLAV